jgi:DNA repair protein RadA/Sms
MNQPIAVLAGTPVDTQMGVDVLVAAGLNGVAYPLSANPREQTMFQVSTPEAKYQFTLDLLKRAMAEGCTKAFVYCNSLSSAVDFPALSKELNMQIVTPLDVYVNLAGGVRQTEPALDLGIIVAVLSSYKNRPIDEKTMVFGEVGLSGEVRSVTMAESRVMEAYKMGFRTCIMPAGNTRKLKVPEDMKLIGIKGLQQVMDYI